MPGKPFRTFFPFALGALAAAVTLVACERPANPAGDVDEPRTQANAAPAPRIEPPRQDAAAPGASQQLPPREALADTVITGKIKAAILTDPALRGADISVNTDRGVVVLAGLVKTPEQTALASAHAQRQDGVVRVDNHLAPAPQ